MLTLLNLQLNIAHTVFQLSSSVTAQYTFRNLVSIHGAKIIKSYSGLYAQTNFVIDILLEKNINIPIGFYHMILVYLFYSADSLPLLPTDRNKQ